MEQERPREVYRECMRNHAAKLGTYAADGCCEYTPDDDRPGALLCAACGCHRNFHRKALLDVAPAPNSLALPGAGIGGGEGGHGGRRRTRTKFTDEQKERMARFAERLGWRMPKREPGRAPGDDEVARFCREIGVTRQVFKVWMHNHKSGGGSGAVGGGAATSSSTTRGGGGGGGGRSPALPGEADTDVEDEEEEVKGNEMCM